MLFVILLPISLVTPLPISFQSFDKWLEDKCWLGVGLGICDR